MSWLHLPDLDQRIADGRAPRVKDSATEVGYLTGRRGERVVDDDQIVVRVQRQMVGIKWAFGLPRRAHQFLGESSGNSEQRGAEGQLAQKAAAAVRGHGR